MGKYHRIIVFVVLFLLISFRLSAETLKLKEAGQELGFQKWGHGPRTILLLPGIGDLKENYSDFAQLLLAEATVYALDLRGLGESSANFKSYGADETGSDIVFFIRELNLKNVTIVANSMSAASTIFAAARLSERVDAIILTGPFIKDTELGFFLKAAIGVMFRGPWGPSLFKSFYKGLYPVNIPKDLEAHSDRIRANLREEGRLSAVREMFFARKPESEKSIANLNTHVVIVMGEKDPDFENPLQVAQELALLTKGKYFMFENCGHYPYKEDPEKLKKILLDTWQKK